jgi:hypothetical protein
MRSGQERFPFRAWSKYQRPTNLPVVLLKLPKLLHQRGTLVICFAIKQFTGNPEHTFSGFQCKYSLHSDPDHFSFELSPNNNDNPKAKF